MLTACTYLRRDDPDLTTKTVRGHRKLAVLTDVVQVFARCPVCLLSTHDFPRQSLRYGGSPTCTSHLAFPDNEDSPAEPSQCTAHACIALHGHHELGLPKLSIALWRRCDGTLRVPMPETSMHEYNGPVPAENDVGLAGQARDVDAESKPEPVEPTANCQLRRRVTASDSRHSR
jgi:hypothetical protein